VETQLLSSFVTVARLASFSAAAVELGYTQAAISQQIAALEADLKVQLLTRRPVAPTEAGARLLEHAEPLLLRLDAARADVARVVQAPAATLAVGASPLAAVTSGLARALALLRRRTPRLEVTVSSGDGAAIAARVARGDLDLGLVHGLTAPGDSLAPLAPLTAQGVAEAVIAVILPVGHPLASQPGARLSGLADARWIDAPGVALPLADVRRAADTDGFRPAIRYDGTDTGTLLALVAAGHGLTLLPHVPLPSATGIAAGTGFASVPITDPPVVHRVELIHGTLRAGSPAAELAGLLTT
jgi:DNA-binding transcriptional LysR family regulator